MLCSLEVMERVAGRLAASLAPGDVVLLKGDVGAGKTTFARALIQSLCPHVADVISPTFSLVQPYEATLASGVPVELWHCDLYRLEHESQLRELGLTDPHEDRILLVEWPELLPAALVDEALAIGFAMPENTQLHHQRVLSLQGRGRWSPWIKEIQYHAAS